MKNNSAQGVKTEGPSQSSISSSCKIDSQPHADSRMSLLDSAAQYARMQFVLFYN